MHMYLNRSCGRILMEIISQFMPIHILSVRLCINKEAYHPHYRPSVTVSKEVQGCA